MKASVATAEGDELAGPGLSCSDGWKPARRGRWRGGPRQLGPQQTFCVERSSRVLEDLHSRGECTRFLPRPQCERKGLGRERQTRGSGPGGAGPTSGEGACHTPPAQSCRRQPRSCSWQSADSRRPAYQKPRLGSARAAVLRGRDPLGAAVTSRSRSPSCSLQLPAASGVCCPLQQLPWGRESF